MTKDFWQSDEPYGLSEGAPLHLASPGSILVQTSGTEGRPKWVSLSRQAFLVSAQAVNEHLEASSQDRWMIALPEHHVGGFAIHARVHQAGCDLVRFPGRWDALCFAQTCARERITLTSLVPTQVYDLVQQRLAAPECLRAIVVGGGALAKDIGRRAVELGWRVLQSFGMTEAASQIATEPLDHLYSGFDPDSLEILPHWQVETDEDDCLILGGPALADGYFLAGEQGGWEWQPSHGVLRTRDCVQVWNHGTRRFLKFLGRDSQTFKILGELVHLPPLQSRLDALAMEQDVSARCVIVPVDDARSGTALVLACDGAAPDLLGAFNSQVRPFERLQRLHQLADLPVTSLGKIRLPELAERLATNP